VHWDRRSAAVADALRLANGDAARPRDGDGCVSLSWPRCDGADSSERRNTVSCGGRLARSYGFGDAWIVESTDVVYDEAALLSVAL